MNRNFVIFDVTEISLIDFSTVMETSADTLRKSVDVTKTFVKWEGDEPACISLLTTKTQIYTYEEILNILVTKYNFLKKSKIIFNDYEIDSNERSINKKKIKVKLTEKELELILTLNNSNGLGKSFLLKSIWKHSLDLDTHAFETHLHRLRKKIYKYFKDDNFITEKNSLYYLVN